MCVYVDLIFAHECVNVVEIVWNDLAKSVLQQHKGLWDKYDTAHPAVEKGPRCVCLRKSVGLCAYTTCVCGIAPKKGLWCGRRLHTLLLLKEPGNKTYTHKIGSKLQELFFTISDEITVIISVFILGAPQGAVCKEYEQNYRWMLHKGITITWGYVTCNRH